MKRLILIPTIFAELARQRVHTDRQSTFFKLLEKKFGFKIISCDSIENCPRSDVEIVLIFGGVHGRKLIRESVKFSKKTKVILYLHGSHCFARNEKAFIPAMKRIDLIICGEDDMFRKKWPQFVSKYVFFPSCLAPHERYVKLRFNEKPLMKCLFSGHTSPAFYPIRNKLRQQVSENPKLQRIIDVMRHPRWQGKAQNLKSWEIDPLMGDAYAQALNRYFCSITTSSVANYVVAKYFEIPAAGSLLLANTTSDSQKVGLIPWEHYIPITQGNVIHRLHDCLANPSAYQDVRRKGMKYVRENHSVKNRVEQFERIFRRKLQ